MRALLLLLVTLLTLPLAAQHCGWDSIHLIVVQVQDEATGLPINGLTLSLTDASGNVYTNKGSTSHNLMLQHYPQKEALVFTQHLTPPTPKGPFDRPDEMAGTNYFLIVYGNNYHNMGKKYGDQIKIEDPSGHYRTRWIPVTSDKIISLCADYDSGDYIDKVMTTYLQPSFAFGTIPVIDTLTDPKTIAKLESTSEWSDGSSFISRFVKKDRTDIVALFKKTPTGCTVYEVPLNYEFESVEMTDNNRFLLLSSRYTFGGRDHSEYSTDLCIIDLYLLRSITLNNYYSEENWQEDSPPTKGSCVCNIVIKNNQLHVKRLVSPHFDFDLYNYIPTGVYDIKNDVLVPVKKQQQPAAPKSKKPVSKSKK